MILANLILFVSFVVGYVPKVDDSPYRQASDAAREITVSADGEYGLPEKIEKRFTDQGINAFFIDNDTLTVRWKSSHCPKAYDKKYSLAEIANLSSSYLDGHPTFIGENENGILVLAYPKDSYFKHTRPIWNQSMIRHLPHYLVIALIANILLLFLIYLILNNKFKKSIDPIVHAIEELAHKKEVNMPERGLLSEITRHINTASFILKKQEEDLSRKEKARIEWIEGISHDIRTPLSLVLGYAGQLEKADYLSKEDKEKMSLVLNESKKIKHLISDLNLLSKIEYSMQALNKERANLVGVLRQVLADFVNRDIEGKYPIEWMKDNDLEKCMIICDKSLISRALTNIIQNAVNHNPHGCQIFVTIYKKDTHCHIIIEDNGKGISEDELGKIKMNQNDLNLDLNTTELRHGIGLKIVKEIVSEHDGVFNIGHSKYGGFKAEIIFRCE